VKNNDCFGIHSRNLGNKLVETLDELYANLCRAVGVCEDDRDVDFASERDGPLHVNSPLFRGHPVQADFDRVAEDSSDGDGKVMRSGGQINISAVLILKVLCGKG
jgi:hypothetical protein